MAGRLFRRLLAFLLIAALLAALAAWGVVRYVRPEPGLNLAARPVDLGAKLKEMALAGKPELVLNDEDVNNIVKSKLGEQRNLAPDLELYGAEFRPDGDRLEGKVALLYKDLVPAGADVRYKLSWQEPELVAEPEQLSVRRVNLPTDRLQTFRIRLLEGIPEVIEVEDVRFEQDGIHILFRANLPVLPLLQDGER